MPLLIIDDLRDAKTPGQRRRGLARDRHAPMHERHIDFSSRQTDPLRIGRSSSAIRHGGRCVSRSTPCTTRTSSRSVAKAASPPRAQPYCPQESYGNGLTTPTTSQRSGLVRFKCTCPVQFQPPTEGRRSMPSTRGGPSPRRLDLLPARGGSATTTHATVSLSSTTIGTIRLQPGSRTVPRGTPNGRPRNVYVEFGRLYGDCDVALTPTYEVIVLDVHHDASGSKPACSGAVFVSQMEGYENRD